MKRFYDRVSLEEERGVYILKLDDEDLLTPKGHVVCHFSYDLMDEVRKEWFLQRDEERLDVSMMGLTCLIHGLLDGVRENRELIIEESIEIFQTDLVLYRAERGRSKNTDELRYHQDQAWDSVVREFERDLGLLLRVVEGIVYHEQSRETMEAVRDWLEGLTEDMLLSVFTTASKCGSLVLGHAFFRGLGSEEVWNKYIVEEKFLIDRMVEDEEQVRRLEEVKVELGHVSRYRKLVL